MISGKYLGEIVRQALLKLINAGFLFEGKSSDVLNKFEGFKSSYLSNVEERVSELFKNIASNSSSCQPIQFKIL